MIDLLTHLISEIFTIDHLCYFVGGWVGGYFINRFNARWQHREPSMGTRALVIFMSWAVLAYVTISTYDNNQCVTEFNRILTVRSNITAEDQSISLQQHRLVYQLIHDIVFPPPDIAKLDSDDPIRQQYVVQQFLNTDQQDTKLFAQQSNNEQQRAKNPLPSPTCG